MNDSMYLILENGLIFEGKSFGFVDDALGEVVFNTSMTGYQEILTDPSYAGQIVILTYPLIGNYGINFEDIESSKPQVSGLIVSEYSSIASNYRSKKNLQEYLIENKIPAIEAIDTRALTRTIRQVGAMKGIITPSDDLKNAKSKLEKHPSMSGCDYVKYVSCSEPYIFKDKKEFKYKIAVYDFGVKQNILRNFDLRDCLVKIFPASTPPSKLLEFEPDGIFLSNGPGDPDAVKYGIENTKQLLSKKPIFGICLGHQILAIAIGAKTYKLKFGHRGANHPVKNLLTGKVEITSQNHGFAVNTETLPMNEVEVTHINLNDGTLEGFRAKNGEFFCIQYHPESSPGPHDSQYLFDEFISIMDYKVK